MANGNGSQGALWKWLAGISTGGASLMLAFAVNVAKDAQIALDVAKQHGEELLMIRGEIQHMQSELMDRTQKRYTSDDAAKDLKYVERWLVDLENKIEDCESRFRENMP